jgi:hypothetical protein
MLGSSQWIDVHDGEAMIDESLPFESVSLMRMTW